MKELTANELVAGVKFKESREFFCEPCQFGKAHKLPFNKTVERSTVPGEFIHSDVCGPMSVESIGGARYYVLFKDDASGFRHIYFMKHKADVSDCFIKYEKELRNKFGRTIKNFRRDNGREYINEKLNNYLTSRGIVHELSAPYTPEQNGRAERDNRTVVECARALLLGKNVPSNLLNRALPSVKDRTKTAYEIWTGKKPDLEHARVFGSTGYMLTPKQFTKKFDSRSKRVLLVGYEGDSSNYRLYSFDTRKISVSRHVSFNEKERQTEGAEQESTQGEFWFSFDDRSEEVAPIQEAVAPVQESVQPAQEAEDDQPVAALQDEFQAPSVA